jgi:PAS domain S-box-containing protein
MLHNGSDDFRPGCWLALTGNTDRGFKSMSTLISEAIEPKRKTTGLDLKGDMDLKKRVDTLFFQHQDKVYRRTSRLFVLLLLAEWVGGTIAAWLVSPKAWAGTSSATHPHVIIALFLGGAIISLPVFLGLKYPERTETRHVIAVAQMLMCALLIHVTGGRIETHFSIFGSLAFLTFYCDWQVLLSATVVVAIDHCVRGFYWPQSVYGTQLIEPLRWLEHAAWVIFEDVFLVWACLVFTREMHLNARRQVEIETSYERVEKEVEERTSNLKESEERLAAQLEITQALNRDAPLEEIAHTALESLCGQLIKDAKYAAFWVLKRETGDKRCVAMWSSAELKLTPDQKDVLTAIDRSDTDLPPLTYGEASAKKIEKYQLDGRIKRRVTRDLGFQSVVGFPLVANQSLNGAIEVYFDQPCELDDAVMTILTSVGHQIGQFLSRVHTEDETNRLTAVVQASPDAIIGLAEDDTVIGWNDAARNLYGHTHEQVKGKVLLDLVAEGDPSMTADLLKRARAGEPIRDYELVQRRRDGSTMYVSMSLTPVYDRAGSVNGLSLFAREISDRKKAVGAGSK